LCVVGKKWNRVRKPFKLRGRKSMVKRIKRQGRCGGRELERGHKKTVY